MFAFNKQQVMLTHINTREEKHGPDETSLAVDLSIKADLSNDFLTDLSPTLKWSLYDKPENADLAQDAGYMPKLRYPELPALSWVISMEGAEVTFHGATAKRDIVLMAKVNKLMLECQEGGTVAVGLRIQSPVTPDQLGALGGLLSKKLALSIIPPNDGGVVGGGEE
jgi:hypothetical protein